MLKLTKAEFDTIPAALQNRYKLIGEEYILTQEAKPPATKYSEEDFDKLRRGKDRETQAALELREKLKIAEGKLDGIDDDQHRKNKDIDAIDKSWAKKLEDQTETHKKELNGKDSYITKSLVSAPALVLANKISTVPDLMLPIIEKRLVADLSGETPITRIKGLDGELSYMKMADLEKELVDNKEYASIIKGIDSSGGGAGGDKKPNTDGGSAKSLSDMTGNEVIALQKDKPEVYKAQLAEADPFSATRNN